MTCKIDVTARQRRQASDPSASVRGVGQPQACFADRRYVFYAIKALEQDLEMSIDLSWKALPPGLYDAAVDKFEFRFGADISIVITYRVPHEDAEYFLDDWLTLDAPKNFVQLSEDG